MRRNRQKIESKERRQELQPGGTAQQSGEADLRLVSSQHPLKEYTKYVTFNVLGMVGLSCYILADTFFVSKALGSQGLAALNLAIPIFNLIRGTGLMLGMGGATRYSILKGQMQEEDANRIFSIVAMTTFFFSLLFVAAGLLFSREIAMAFGAAGPVLGSTSIYLKVLCCFAPFFMLNDMMICFIRNDGDPNLAMAAMVIGSLANILLDYIFIFPCNMGIFGAALATGMSPMIGLCLASLHWTKRPHSLRFVRSRDAFSAKSVAGDLGISAALGFPSFITELSSGIVILVFNLLILDLAGNTGVAAYGVIANISLVIIAIYTGIAQGIQPLMSRAFGERRMKLVRQNLHYALWTIAAASIVIYGIVFFLADGVTGIFNSEGNAELQTIAVTGLKLYFLAIFFAGTNISLAMYFTSTQRAFPAHAISLLRGLLLIVPAAFLLAEFLGLCGVWLSFPVTEVLVFLLAAIIYCTSRRKDVY